MQILFEPHDAARILGITPLRVRQLVQQGRLTPAARTPRGCKLFDPKAVDALRAVREQAKRRV